MKLYFHIYSEKEPGFKSTTDETQKALDFCFTLPKDERSISIDRGYDNENWMKLIAQSKNEFVIRMKRNRNVIYKG